MEGDTSMEEKIVTVLNEMAEKKDLAIIDLHFSIFSLERNIMKRKFYEVSPRTLLIIAGMVWMLAGYNVARLGVISYLEINVHWYHLVLSVIIFLLFGTMFAKMTKKHGK